ncbi:MAG: membrane dipeptidase [Actinobacteria bacterium]|jgi:membrane dipeptidase|nr:membrane dipeptidase [Actinomycetota bacterium]
METEISDTAARLHEESIVIDGLVGSMMNLDPVMDGGLTAGNITLASSSTQDFLPVLRSAMEYHDLARVDDRAVMVHVAEDIVRAKEAGKAGFILGVQGCDFLGRDLDNIWIAQRCGLRIMQPTYNEENLLGYGCLEKTDHGLKAYGRIVIREFNRLNMLVDVAHVGQQTALDCTEASATPTILSHCNTRALNDNPRCVSDELIKEVGAAGGVVGISTYSSFAETTYDQRPTVEDVLRHISHAIDLVGVDHVGIGTDCFEARSPVSFERAMVRKYPEVLRTYMTAESRHAIGMGSSRSLPKLTQGMLDLGMPEDDIRKVLGLNFLRVFTEVFGEART